MINSAHLKVPPTAWCGGLVRRAPVLKLLLKLSGQKRSWPARSWPEASEKLS